jgi:hypothetical protein
MTSGAEPMPRGTFLERRVERLPKHAGAGPRCAATDTFRLEKYGLDARAAERDSARAAGQAAANDGDVRRLFSALS